MKQTALGIFGNTKSSAVSICGSFKEGFRVFLCELFLQK